MKFTLKVSREVFNEEEQMKVLEPLGFEFSDGEPSEWIPGAIDFFKVGEAPTIEINTLEELMEFAGKWGQLVISSGTIEIYDTYRE